MHRYIVSRTIPSVLIRGFIQATHKERKLSLTTLEAYAADLCMLEERLGKKGILLAKAMERDIREDIAQRRSNGIKDNSIARQMTSTKAFYRYLVSRSVCSEDPTRAIGRPRGIRAAPRPIIERDELDALLAASDLSDPFGYRNRTMLEILATTKIRTSALIMLTVEHIDFQNQLMLVEGRGDAMSEVPLHDSSMTMLKIFLEEHRPKILAGYFSPFLFPTVRKFAMSRQAFWHVTRSCAKKAGITKNVRSHDVRLAYEFYNGQ